MIWNELKTAESSPRWKCLESRTDSKRSHYGRFSISPLLKGQANTLAIAIRKTLLQEVKGTYITYARFQKNILHEYSSIIGIKESVHDILMNLKQIVLRSELYGIHEASICTVGPKNVTAQDIILPSSIQIIDDTQHIASLTKRIPFNVTLKIEKKKRYTIENMKQPKDIFFPIDGVSLPVQNVNFSIHSYKSSDNIQEMLIFEIWTNGGLTPRETIYEACWSLLDLIIPLLCVEQNIKNSQKKPNPLSLVTKDRNKKNRGEGYVK
uniref:RNA polymerase alpha subunit n=10 Tax=Ephedra TaxID=3387 RepID=A0A8F4YMZ8_9SPER|nr:RNA polymerase alpha subunit [Ephedra sinica]YP_010207364.1 RNA polymerase alpha subunit [Ephedra przewalskii]YP_010452541.1 RNA polymerase alpha subunit [Ephedra distachya]YP_010453075.1 RNA polymerase alpha subunit [Ephedra lomatolepis]YP_010453209.1 RNA polymerase alpha subunit [Ephedra milleri]YP_010453410.1 RNA polymerase alpha subunit [Ephedra pachyclada]YP_010453611.1 RNA polymerase alpha subunit [Ephedra somalensis]YP_010453812.1 RNA polymerase alpha subunit [Ephedra transitoria]